MIAILEIDGKQHKVSEGTVIDVEKQIVEPGKSIKLDRVLLISDEKSKLEIGHPFIEKAVVTAKCLEQKKDKKKIVFHFKRKTGFKRTRGHRQQLTTLQITGIEIGKPAKKAVDTKTEKEAPKKAESAKKAPEKKKAPAKKTTAKKSTSAEKKQSETK